MRPGGRKSDANSLQVADFEHELVVVKQEKIDQVLEDSQRKLKQRQDTSTSEATKRILSPRKAKERGISSVKDVVIKSEPGKDNENLKIKLKFSKHTNNSPGEEKTSTKKLPGIKNEMKDEPKDHIVFNERTMDLSFFTEANLRSTTEEEVMEQVEGNLKVWVSKYHGPSLVPAKKSKYYHSSPKPRPATKPKEEPKTFQIKIKKEPEGRTSVESYAKSPAKTPSTKKSKSCGSCKGCLNTQDCGKCLNCLDNVKSGGKAAKKLRCSKRMCKVGARARKILESLPPVQTCQECNLEVLGGREPYEKHMLLWHNKYFSTKYHRFFSVKEDKKLKVKIRRSNEVELKKPKTEPVSTEVCQKNLGRKRSKEKDSTTKRRSMVAIQHTCDTADQMVDIGLKRVSL